MSWPRWPEAPTLIVEDDHPSGRPGRAEWRDITPTILVSAELLDVAYSFNPAYFVHNRAAGTLTLQADNGSWIYRICEYDPQRNAYRCKWPD